MAFGFSASYIALWVVVVFQGLLVLALLRQLAELRQFVEWGALPGEDLLPAGSPAPEFAEFDARSGREVSSGNLDGRGVVILFLSAECSVCRGLADSIRQSPANGLPPIIVLCHGEEQACAGYMTRLGLEVQLVLKGAEEMAARYRVSGFPTAVLVDGERKIRGYGHPKDVDGLKRLLSRSLGERSTDAGPDPGVAMGVSSSGGTQ